MRFFAVLLLALFGTACVPKDIYNYHPFREPVSQLSQAAEAGDTKAQFKLGGRYYNGDEVLQNYGEAFRWYRKAAERGHAGAQNSLGMMYFEGKSVPRDAVQAHMWLNLAASQEDKFAENRDYVAKRMTSEQIIKAQEMAREWKPLAVPVAQGAAVSQGEVPNVVVRKFGERDAAAGLGHSPEVGPVDELLPQEAK
ncbi:MAG: sel1 repeat family protein [Magnetococcales bacterium]|nr:sel1 repeat family protein [Magnetococcales bacterium]